MKKLRSLRWGSIAMGLLVAFCAGAEDSGKEFSAEMVQRGPEGEMSSGKMYVGDQRTRTEMLHQGQQVIRITDEKRGVEWILFPEQKQYMEHEPTGPGGGKPEPTTSPAADPCAGLPGLACRNLGEETLGGRTAVKWEMVASYEGQSMKSTQWIDKERGLALRQEMPNGQTTELKLIGKEKLGDREVEKWEMIATQPDQQPMRTFQWYDPQLELVVRQEFPGGFVSELKDLRVGKQPDSLFAIPAGYERMSLPQGMPDQPPGGNAPGR